MTSQIPGISSTQSTAPVNAVASQQSNVTTPPEAPITQIDEQNGAKAMNGNDYIQKTASVLQNTYFFEKDEARQISAFATAVRETDLKDLCPNVKPGFLDKIKALCARILQLFKVDSKSIQLHKDGIAVFDRLKNTLLIPENKDFVLEVIKANGNNKEALKGFARVVVFEPDENLDLRTQLEAFINTNYFNKLDTYVGKNGKIAFYKKVLDQCLDPSLTLEDKQKNLETFLKVFNKHVEMPDLSKMTTDEYFCFSVLALGYSAKLKESLKSVVKHKGDLQKLQELDSLKENIDKHVRLFQALRNCNINGMKDPDVDNLKNLMAFANKNNLAARLALSRNSEV